MCTEPMRASASLDQVLAVARQLSPADQVRLIAQLAANLEHFIEGKAPTPRKSLRGLWRGLGITDHDIASDPRHRGRAVIGKQT